MSDELKEICAQALYKRINEAEKLTQEARNLIIGEDYLQAAVRLELLRQQSAFTETELSIFSAASNSASRQG